MVEKRRLRQIANRQYRGTRLKVITYRYTCRMSTESLHCANCIDSVTHTRQSLHFSLQVSKGSNICIQCVAWSRCLLLMQDRKILPYLSLRHTRSRSVERSRYVNRNKNSHVGGICLKNSEQKNRYNIGTWVTLDIFIY